MTDARDLRDALERAQEENRTLRQVVTGLSAEVKALEGQLVEAQAERERLARVVLRGLNPEGGKSAFSVENVAALVAYLKAH